MSEWIKLSERKPDFEVEVLTTDGEYQHVAEMVSIRRGGPNFLLCETNRSDESDRSSVNVVYWKPLDKLPQDCALCECGHRGFKHEEVVDPIGCREHGCKCRQFALREPASGRNKENEMMFGNPTVMEQCADHAIIDGDSTYRLDEFKRVVERLIIEYGADSYIRFDAGHNNVLIMIKRVT